MKHAVNPTYDVQDRLLTSERVNANETAGTRIL